MSPSSFRRHVEFRRHTVIAGLGSCRPGFGSVLCRAVADALPPTGSGLIDVIAGVLAENGPMTEDRLLAVVVSRGVDLGDDADDALAEALDDGDGLVTVLADERWASLPALLAGRTFTHRLSSSELEHDILVMDSDLKPVDMLTECAPYQRLADGSPVVGVLMPFDADTVAARGIPLDVVGDLGALLLPPGYLRGKGLSEGDVIALGLAAGDGLLLESIPEPAVRAETVSTLGQRLSTVLEAEPDEPTPLDVAVWTACADDPTLFTEPLPPLAEALDTCGLAHDGEWLAVQGFDFRRWQVDERCAAIARVHDLSDNEALAVLAMVIMYDQLVKLHAAALAVDEDGGETALAAFVAELTSLPELSPTDLGRVHDEEATVKATAVRATTVFLAQPAVAEAVLAETIGSGIDGAAVLGLFAETLEPLALPAARPALRWLRGKAHERLGDLTHLHHEQLPLDERAAWLYQKAGMFLVDGPWRSAVMEAAQVRAQFDEDPDALLDALDVPLVTDAVLFEGGAFAEFVATRGVLLPEDERLLAEQWLLIDRSVYEIEHVRRGAGFTMRDVRTGDVHQVRERTASQVLKAGALVCARVVPAGDTTQIFGGIEPVAAHERDGLIALLDSEPDPLDLVGFLTRPGDTAPADEDPAHELDPAVAAAALELR